MKTNLTSATKTSPITNNIDNACANAVYHSIKFSVRTSVYQVGAASFVASEVAPDKGVLIGNWENGKSVI